MRICLQNKICQLLSLLIFSTKLKPLENVFAQFRSVLPSVVRIPHCYVEAKVLIRFAVLPKVNFNNHIVKSISRALVQKIAKQQAAIVAQFYRKKKSPEEAALLVHIFILHISSFQCSSKYISICRNLKISWFRKFCRNIHIFLSFPVEAAERFVFDTIKTYISKVN